MHSRLLGALFQEHKQKGDDWQRFREKAGRKRWELVGTPAVDGENGGCSAGTAVAAHMCGSPLGTMANGTFQVKGKFVEGRLAGCWTPIAGSKGRGLLMLSAYFWTNMGPTHEQNVAIYEAIAIIVKEHKGPWLLGADFQCNPDELRETCWPEVLGAEIVAPDEQTTAAGSCIDFFLLDKKAAAQVVQVKAWEWPMRVHRPVELLLNAKVATQRVLKIKEPKAFPRARPIGPARPPEETPVWDSKPAGSNSEDRDTLMLAAGSRWSTLIRSMEGEMCGICDLFVNDEPDNRYRGRGQERRYEWTPVWPVCAGQFGATSVAGRAKAVLAATLGRMEKQVRQRAARTAAGNEDEINKEEARTREALRCSKGLLKKAWKEEEQQCRKEIEATAEDRGAASLTKAIAIAQLAAKAKRGALEEKKAWSKTTSESCKRWLEEQRRKGHGAIHKITKEQKLEGKSPTTDQEGRKQICAQKRTDEEQEKWSKVWDKHKEIAKAPWRQTIGMRLQRGEGEPPPLTAEDLRRAALTFPENKGYLSWSPRWFAWLSAGLLGAIADFLGWCEQMGCGRRERFSSSSVCCRNRRGDLDQFASSKACRAFMKGLERLR